MVLDTDIPELPFQFQLAPVYYAGSMIGGADGSATSAFCLQEFERQKSAMAEWRRMPQDSYSDSSAGFVPDYLGVGWAC
jgi:hypothetical protein